MGCLVEERRCEELYEMVFLFPPHSGLVRGCSVCVSFPLHLSPRNALSVALSWDVSVDEMREQTIKLMVLMSLLVNEQCVYFHSDSHAKEEGRFYGNPYSLHSSQSYAVVVSDV